MFGKELHKVEGYIQDKRLEFNPALLRHLQYWYSTAFLKLITLTWLFIFLLLLVFFAISSVHLFLSPRFVYSLFCYTASTFLSCLFYSSGPSSSHSSPASSSSAPSCLLSFLCPVKRSTLLFMGSGLSACGVWTLRPTRPTKSRRRKETTRSTKMWELCFLKS